MTPAGTCIASLWKQRLPQLLPPRDAQALLAYMSRLIYKRALLPMNHNRLDWVAIAEASGVALDVLMPITKTIESGFGYFQFALQRTPPLPSRVKAKLDRALKAKPRRRRRRTEKTPAPAAPVEEVPPRVGQDPPVFVPRRRGPVPRPIANKPEPILVDDRHPPEFAKALDVQMRRYGETAYILVKALALDGVTLEPSTLGSWLKGRTAPRTLNSRKAVKLIERRYRLEDDYLMSRLPIVNRAAYGHELEGVDASERRRLAWHLPDDFAERPVAEQDEIVAWVRQNVLTADTSYSRFHAAAVRQVFALRFEGLDFDEPDFNELDEAQEPVEEEVNELHLAPPWLSEEMRRLVEFKSATLVTEGLNREGVWGVDTAEQRTEHLALMLGALVASPTGAVRGRGVPLTSLTLGLLVFPAVWDWYLKWREARRGFFTRWEGDMLALGLSMARAETGWLRQHPGLADRLVAIPGLVSQADIDAARADWSAVCDKFMKHGLNRKKEILRVKKVHRDPFENILPILEAASPLGEYRKITEEIVATMPNERKYPVAAAEAVRAFLALRLGLHLGARQKNLRQLLVKHRHEIPSAERHLEDRKRGELRWSSKDAGWEVLIPAVAFKNSGSSYFGGKAFRLLLPDLGGLYAMIDAYLDRHRAVLLHGADDPRTFFVKAMSRRSKSAEYCQTAFFELWRLTIQRYGIFNPWTGRGVIKGLMPHGPHAVRDVLATHVLKVTGSFEQASYAIQDTPETVQMHYGRFLPEDKAALAAKVLNLVWQAA